MRASWISPHKFTNKTKHINKKLQQERKEQQRRKAAEQEKNDDENIFMEDDNKDDNNDHHAILDQQHADIEEAEGQSQFSSMDKWFDIRPSEAQLKSRIVFSSGMSQQQQQPQQQRSASVSLKIMEEMLRAAIEVYNAKINEKESLKRNSGFSFEDEIIRKGTSSDKIAALSLMAAKDPTHNMGKLDQVLRFCSSSNGRVAELAVKTIKDLMLNNLLPTGDRATNSGALFPLVSFKDRDIAMLYDAIIREQELKVKKADEEEHQQKKDGNLRKRITFNKDGTRNEITEDVSEVAPIDVESLVPLHERFLFFWYFEDLMKKRLIQFVDILVNRAKSTTPSLQIRAVLDLRDMIRGTSNGCEVRVTIMRAIIDKLKDKNTQVASSTMKFMTSLLNPILSAEDASYNPFYVKDLDRHFVVREVAQLLYNPNLPSESKLYAATLLNRIELMEKVDRDLAKDLIACYLKTCEIHFRKNESDSSTMRAVLTGIHRAIGVAEARPEQFSDTMDTIFIISRKAHFNNAVEALRVIWMLLDSVADSRLVTRFYTILYDKLFDEGIRLHATKTSTFLSLLFKAMKKDTNSIRQRAFCKRILQSALMGTTEYACSCILLLKNFFNYHPNLKNMYENSESLLRKGEGALMADDDGNDDDDDDDDDMEDDSVIRMKTNRKQGNSSPKTNTSGNIDRNAIVMYDPTMPAPDRTNAEIVSLYEMLPFAHYFHPSGSRFADSTVKNRKIKNFEGNPMEDFTVIRFLDKFMYRKAKTKLSLNPLKSLHTAANDFTLEKQIEALSANADDEKNNLPPRYMVQPDEMFKFKFLQKQSEADRVREVSSSTKQKEKMQLISQYRQTVIEESDKKLDVELTAVDDTNLDENDDNMSVFSYSDLDRVLQEDALDDEAVEDLMLENMSSDDELDDMDDMDNDDDDDDGGHKTKRHKAQESFGYDITASTKDEPDQDEMAALFEEGEEELFQAARQQDKSDQRYDPLSEPTQGGQKRRRDGSFVVNDKKNAKKPFGGVKKNQQRKQKQRRKNTRK